VPEDDDERPRRLAAQSGEAPPLGHDDREPARSALEELRNYPFFADDDEDFDVAPLGGTSGYEHALAATPAPVIPSDGPTETPPLCPYLGSSFDRSHREDVASDTHRCWRTTAPVPIDARWQDWSCLTGACRECARYLDPLAPVPVPPPPPQPPHAHEVVNGLPGPPPQRRWAGDRRFTGLAASLLCCALIATAALAIGPSRAPRAAPSATLTPAAPAVAARDATPPATPSPGAAPAASPPDTAAAPTPVSPGTATSIPTGATPLPAAAPPVSSPPLDRDTPIALRQRAIARQNALQTVQLDATIDYGNGTSASGQVRFDRGGTPDTARLAIAETYRGATGTRSGDFLQIAAQAWQRTPGEPWQPVVSPEGILERLRAYLFPVGAAEDVTRGEQDADTVTLHWYDPGSDADVTLQLDRATAIPRQWRQVSRPTGQVMTVRYSGWDAPVDIPPAP